MLMNELWELQKCWIAAFMETKGWTEDEINLNLGWDIWENFI